MVDLFDSWHAAEPGRGYDAMAAEWREIFDAWQAEHGTEQAK